MSAVPSCAMGRNVRARMRHPLHHTVPSMPTIDQWNLEMKVIAIMARRRAMKVQDILWLLDFHDIAHTHEVALRIALESLRRRGLLNCALFTSPRRSAYRLTRRGRLCQDVIQLTPGLNANQAQSVGMALGC